MYSISWWASSTDPSTDPPRPLYTVKISGPRSVVTAHSIVWVTDRPDYVEDMYWGIVNCLDGVYHCCFTGNVDWL